MFVNNFIYNDVNETRIDKSEGLPWVGKQHGSGRHHGTIQKKWSRQEKKSHHLLSEGRGRRRRVPPEDASILERS